MTSWYSVREHVEEGHSRAIFAWGSMVENGVVLSHRANPEIWRGLRIGWNAQPYHRTEPKPEVESEANDHHGVPESTVCLDD